MSVPNIGPQIGLRGVDAYQMDLKTATQATKTFKAELDAVAKIKNPFEQAVKGTSALDSEINAQKRRVELLGEAYQKAVEKYGALSKQALKAQEDLAKGQKALETMLDQYKQFSTAKIEIPGVGEFKRDLETLTQSTKTFKAEFQSITSGFGVSGAFTRAAESSEKLKNSIELQKETIKLLQEDYQNAVREQGEFSAGAMEMREKVANATTELNNMQKTLRDLPNGLQTAGKEVVDFGNKWKETGRHFTEAAKPFNMFTGVYVAAMGGAIKVSTDYEAALAKVQAVTDLTTEEMAELSDTLLEMSKGSIYAPKQLAEGMEKVARAGITDINEQVAVLGASLNLATAEGAGFDNMADGLISTLYQFDEPMTEAADAADIIAVASRSAKTDASLLFETFKQAAPSMKAMNFTLRDTALAADLMADSALVGSQAGTYLKTSMANLTAPTDKQRAAMEKFNISLTDGNGKSISFVQLLEQLRTSFGGLDVELANANGELKDADELFNELSGHLPQEQLEKLEGVVTIFGKRALPGMLAMINATDERFDELKENLTETRGVAAQMAKIVGDSTQGGWQKLSAGLQVLGIEIGQSLLPIINDFLIKATEWVTKFSEMDDGTKKFIITAGAVLALIGPILTGIGGLSTGIGTLISSGGHLMQGIGGLGKLLGGSGGLLSMIGGAGKGLVGGIAKLAASFGPLIAAAGPWLIAGAAIVAAGVLIYKNWDKIKETAAELKDWASQKWKELKDSVVKTTDELKKSASEKWESIKRSVSEKAGAAKKAVTDAWDSLKNGTRDAYDAIKGKISGTFDKIREAAGSLKDRIKEIGDSIKSTIKGLVDSALTWGKDMIDNFVSGIKQKVEAVKNAAKGIAKTVKDILGFSVPEKGPLSDADTYMPDFIDLLVGGLRQGTRLVEAASTDLAKSIALPSFYADLPDMGAGGTTTNMGGVNIVINAQPGQDVYEIADLVEERISHLMNRREVSYA